MKKYIFALLVAALSASCSKVIEVEYESIDPIYIAVASLTSDDGGSLLLTQSSDMDEAAQSNPITSATAWITSSLGESFALSPNDEGVYQTEGEIELTEGADYTLSIEVDGQSFTATSHLYEAPIIGEVSFSQQEFMDTMLLVFCSFNIMDREGEQNYYRYRFRYFANDNEESGEPSWSLTKESVDGDPIPIMTHLYTMDRDLEDGDQITIEVQAIDKATYQFLYTLSTSSSSSTNPTSAFEQEGCLGYFSASSLSSEVVEFYY
ncbi:MAG: DUF4249 family protein [Rikenellaceae bacterium]